MKVGQRKSKQRDIILEELKGVTSHPTADELYEMVRKRVPNISLGTVYRNLELMVAGGIIQKLDAGGKKRFDANNASHPHIRCVKCGRIEDVHIDVEIRDISNVDAHGFKVIGCNVEYLGICPECRGSRDH